MKPAALRLLLPKAATLPNVVAIVVFLGSSSPSTAQRGLGAEIEAGAQAALQVEAQMGIYDAKATTGYVRAIGERLVAQLDSTPYRFTFQVVDQFDPNAFALPGGHIYVSRGLLLLANTEDEIAGVLGHEIIHVTRRHAVRRSRRGLLPGILSVPGAIVGGVVSSDLGNLINAPITAVGKVTLSSYSRGQEREADELGMQLAAKAGYEPKELAVILGQMEREVELLTGETRKASFFNSHPTTPKRVKGIEKGAAQLRRVPKPAIATDQADFLNKLDGLHVGDNPAQGIFREQQFMHPDLGFSITFPESWQTVNNTQMVGGFAPDQSALAALAPLDGVQDVEALADEFLERLRKKYRVEPTEARRVEIGDWPAYLVTLSEGSGRKAANMHYLWVTAGDLTYILIAAGPESARPTLRELALSFRPLTSEERASITGVRLRATSANDGETLEQLSDRSDNVLKADFTRLINNLAPSSELEAGQLVKIARREKH